MGSKMDNEMGMSILSSILHRMSYPNMVVSKEDGFSGIIDVKDLHSLLLKGCQTNQRIPESLKLTLVERECSEGILIHVKTLTGKTININIKVTACVKDVKEKIQSKEGLPLDQQRLIFAGRKLEDDEILDHVGIKADSTLHLFLMISGGGPGILLSADGLLDERFHFDFTSVVDNKAYSRGGLVYIRPCGWKRFALKVGGKYKDNTWLLGKGNRPDPFSSAEEEWPVSYHGTSYNNGLSIAEEGYRLSQCKRFKHGFGIYSTPEIDVAFKYAETRKQADGKTYKVVIQNRVNPKTLIKIDKVETKVGEYWISPSEEDIRPYGFCTREC
jgi:ubiquitin